MRHDFARQARLRAGRIDRSVSGEEDLPTQQDRAQAPARLPRPHGDCRRPQGDRRAPRPGPEEAFRLTDTATTTGRLKRRAEFQKVARGHRVHSAAFTLQAGASGGDAEAFARFGFTVTKKVGNAVVRNRIRRRLREAVRLSEVLSTRAGTDYVVVARREALAIPFDRLMADLEASVRKSGQRSGARRARPVAADTASAA